MRLHIIIDNIESIKMTFTSHADSKKYVEFWSASVNVESSTEAAPSPSTLICLGTSLSEFGNSNCVWWMDPIDSSAGTLSVEATTFWHSFPVSPSLDEVAFSDEGTSFRRCFGLAFGTNFAPGRTTKENNKPTWHKHGELKKKQKTFPESLNCRTYCVQQKPQVEDHQKDPWGNQKLTLLWMQQTQIWNRIRNSLKAED